MTAITTVEEVREESTSLVLQASDPVEVVQRATRIANALRDVISKNKLASQISGREYVRCEGWTTMGAMLGVTPHEISVTEHDGIFTAVVALCRIGDGVEIARASAECGAPDELDRRGQPLWSARPRYARRSMALTRATSKVCRLAFSWIMTLAGYEATPAEEVPSGGFEEHQQPASDDSGKHPGPTEPQAMVLPFGKKKGTPLKDLTSEELSTLSAWCRKKNTFPDLVEAADEILSMRGGE